MNESGMTLEKRGALLHSVLTHSLISLIAHFPCNLARAISQETGAMQNPSHTCPQCHSPIPADAPGGLCPACVLLGVAGPTNPSQAIAANAPTIEEVAAAFPELEILELIGQGGMGVVFKARQPRLDRLVALKILPPALAAQPGFAERFTREARVLARLAHPHIVGIYDFGESAGFFYLIMEFVNGVNLRAAMRAGVKPEQALLLVPHICEALQFAHDHGVLHRDIKPENILLDTAGTPKLADFGIAKLAGEESLKTGLTATGAALGTAAYMAPEQVEKPATVDHRADIYSLGVVLYEMLTGELPLGRFGAPSEKSSVNRGVDEVVMRALEKERERRQQSATAMKTEVERATQSGARPVLPAASLHAGNPLVTKVFVALCVLSAVGIPIAGMLHTSTPSPGHMVGFTILFGVLTGLSKLFEPDSTTTTARIGRKDLGFAYLFWFLFGLMGGHKFYLRQYGWGWLYFFTAGLFFIGWIIDLFTLPEQVRRVNEELRGTPPVTGLANPDHALNPWPRRVFLLIVLIFVVPIGVGMVLPVLGRISLNQASAVQKRISQARFAEIQEAAKRDVTAIQNEAIRIARERLNIAKANVQNGTMPAIDQAAAERDLAVAEARDDEAKVAAAHMAYAEIRLKMLQENAQAGHVSASDVLEGEKALNAARLRLQVEQARAKSFDALRPALELPSRP